MFGFFRRSPAAQSPVAEVVKKIKPSGKLSAQDYEALLSKMLGAGLQFQLPAELSHAIEQGTAAACGVMKHDVHHDLDACLVAARIESVLGVKSVFFFLGEHDLTRKFHGTPRFWQAIEEIVSLGHEIGIHTDAHDLLERHGDLEQGMAHVMEDFRKHAGVRITSGNLHGNTALRQIHGSPKAMIKARNDDAKSIPHKFPMLGDKFLRYENFYSLENFSKTLGIDCWLDARVYWRGNRLPVDAYLTDNSSALRLLLEKKNAWIVPFAEVVSMGEESFAPLAKRPFQVLFHPQNISG